MKYKIFAGSVFVLLLATVVMAADEYAIDWKRGDSTGGIITDPDTGDTQVSAEWCQNRATAWGAGSYTRTGDGECFIYYYDSNGEQCGAYGFTSSGAFSDDDYRC